MPQPPRIVLATSKSLTRNGVLVQILDPEVLCHIVHPVQMHIEGEGEVAVEDFGAGLQRARAEMCVREEGKEGEGEKEGYAEAAGEGD